MEEQTTFYYFRPRDDPSVYSSFLHSDFKNDDREILEGLAPSKVTIDCSEGMYLNLKNLGSTFADIITIFSTDENACINTGSFEYRIGKGRYTIPNFMTIGSSILKHSGSVNIELRMIDAYLHYLINHVPIVIPIENVVNPEFDACVIQYCGVDNIRMSDLCKIPVNDNSEDVKPFLDIGLLHRTPDLCIRAICKD